jgi:hypothetical protein
MVYQRFGFNPGYRLARAIKRKLIDHESFRIALAQDRMVFHAFQ